MGHWEKVNRINYMGVVCTLKAALPGMVARKKGRIIVTNSSGGFMGATQATFLALGPGFRMQCTWLTITLEDILRNMGQIKAVLTGCAPPCLVFHI